MNFLFSHRMFVIVVEKLWCYFKYAQLIVSWTELSYILIVDIMFWMCICVFVFILEGNEMTCC